MGGFPRCSGREAVESHLLDDVACPSLSPIPRAAIPQVVSQRLTAPDVGLGGSRAADQDGPTPSLRGGSPPGHRASGPRASPPGGVEGFGVAGVDATSGTGLPNRSLAGGAGFGGSVTTGTECACFGPLAFSHSTPMN